MLYVGNAGDGTISAYVIDQDSGFLTELLPRAPSPGVPTSVAIHPSGKFVYATNGGNPAAGVNGPSITAFSINPATGALEPLASLPLTPGTGPQGAAIDPAGKFLFVGNNGAGNVSVYSIDNSTGALSAVPGSPFAAPQGPNKVVVHPNGNFAYVAGSAAGQIAVYSIAGDGTLKQAPGSPFAARNNLFSMAMDSAGKFLFVTERQDAAVLVYSVNADTGALTQVGSPVPAGPGVTGVAADPTGKFLYVTTAGDGGAIVFRIGDTGALTQGRRSGVILGAFDAILDPSGKFLYIPGQQANAVAGLSIDANNGTLSQLPQPFFPAGAQPQRGAAILLYPPVLPPTSVDEAANLHSRALPGMANAGIAQGSRLLLSGKNIGPATTAFSDFPLGTELGGASVQIQSGDVTTAALIVGADNNSVDCVVPSNTPLGDATVTVTYKGRTTAPMPITIVQSSVGLRTLNKQGTGPAKAFAAPPDTVPRPDPALLQNPVTLSQSATPGQLVIVQATGLGAVTIDETLDLIQELSVPADVIVGNLVVPAIYELRVAVGGDYIAFKLPDETPEGCYVPIAIRTGGIVSNVATISVAKAGGSCSDQTGFTASDIDAAQKSGAIRMGIILLSHLDLGPFGTNDVAYGVFTRYDVNALMQAFSLGGSGDAIRSAFPIPPLGTCNVLSGTITRENDLFGTPVDRTPFQFLNAGPTINLNGPAKTFPLQAPGYQFSANSYVFIPGDYSVDNGTGSPAVGPFKAAMKLRPMLTWTNMADVTAPDRTQDLTVTWSGGASDQEFATIAGLSEANNRVTSGFLCTEKVAAGKFTVPSWVLSNLPKSGVFALDATTNVPGGIVGVGTASFPSAGRFTANGLDFGALMYEQTKTSLLLFQ